MRRSRVSILGLMGIVLAIGVCIVSLRLANEAWAGLVVMGTFSALCVSILRVVYRREAKRAFWLGFAVLAWGYLIFGSKFVGVFTTVEAMPWTESEPAVQGWITGVILKRSLFPSP